MRVKLTIYWLTHEIELGGQGECIAVGNKGIISHVGGLHVADCQLVCPGDIARLPWRPQSLLERQLSDRAQTFRCCFCPATKSAQMVFTLRDRRRLGVSSMGGGLSRKINEP